MLNEPERRKVARDPDADPAEIAFRAYAEKFESKLPLSDYGDSSIVKVTLTDLAESTSTMRQLESAYRRIFGSGEIWAEGAFCQSDPSHMISLEEYEKRRVAGDLICGCGGSYTPCYPEKYFSETIAAQLTDAGGLSPFCSLYVSDDEVQGFIWGAVGPLQKCIERMLAVPKWVDGRRWREFVQAVEVRLQAQFGMESESGLLYIDDLGILPEARKGIEPLMLLLRQAYSHAVRSGCQRALCWTSKKSPLYTLARYSAYKEVLSNDEGLVFMLCPDITPAFRILQAGPRAMLPILVKNARLVRRAS